MFDAYGWIIVRSERPQRPATLEEEEILKREVEQADVRLWSELEDHLSAYGVPSEDVHRFDDGLAVRPIGLSLIKWSFYRELNYTQGLLQLATARNHFCEDFSELINWIAARGPGSYGVIYVRDDENPRSKDVFQVWRLCGGAVEVYPDELLSPISEVVHDWI